MLESTQHALSRVRPPRVQITYDVEVGKASEKKELPFVIGILADLVGASLQSLPVLRERQFIFIDRDNFNDVMRALNPRLAFSVPSFIVEGTTLDVELTLQHIKDFSPIRIVQQTPSLNELYISRIQLVDLTSKLEGNDTLEAQLHAILISPELQETLQAEAEAPEDKDLPVEMQKIIAEGKLAYDTSQLIHARNLLKEFIIQLKRAPQPFPENPYSFIMACIERIDTKLSHQLDEILHHPDFQKLEGSWRSLHYLVMHAETGSSLKLRLLPLNHKEMLDDLEKALEFDQSQLFKKIYEEEYGTFGGDPYSCLVADFEFGRHPQDIEILKRFSHIAAAAHTPLLAAAGPRLFDMESFEDMGKPRDLTKIFESSEMIKWNSFRQSEDSRYVALTLPHILIRQPYGSDTVPVQEFHYEESVDGEDNRKFCWGNPAYMLAERIASAFSHYGWTAAIRGVEGGGLVEDLPVYTFKTARGDCIMKCPTEITITDRREKELSNLGFISLCHCKGKDYAAFFGVQTVQKPKVYNLQEANANALLSTRLSYLLNASRFAHYIKAIMRDKIGTFMSAAEVEFYLQNWLGDYVLLSDFGDQDTKARYPLREGRVKVIDVMGKPGAYKAVIFLRPHFQLEELTVSLRLVANLPASTS